MVCVWYVYIMCVYGAQRSNKWFSFRTYCVCVRDSVPGGTDVRREKDKIIIKRKKNRKLFWNCGGNVDIHITYMYIIVYNICILWDRLNLNGSGVPAPRRRRKTLTCPPRLRVVSLACEVSQLSRSRNIVTVNYYRCSCCWVILWIYCSCKI